MKRIVMAIAATAAVVPAALGLLGNESFAQSLPTAVPASVQLVSACRARRRGRPTTTAATGPPAPPSRGRPRRPAAHLHLIEHERLVLEHDRIVVEHLVPVILERLDYAFVLLHLRRLGRLRRQLGLGLWLRLGRQLGLGFGFLGQAAMMVLATTPVTTAAPVATAPTTERCER